MKTFIFCSSLLLSFQLAVFADTQAQRKSHYNLNSAVALGGYDPVAYFTGGAKKGSSKIKHAHDGVTYYFASDSNRKKFIASPDKYEAEYGGWCAYAMAVEGSKVRINPQRYKIVGGKLYLFYDAFPGGNTLKKWNKKADSSQIQAADRYWSGYVK
ncbi:MAG: YHS domain-containing (seleno)protein [Verrucomicrobiota bacterium]